MTEHHLPREPDIDRHERVVWVWVVVFIVLTVVVVTLVGLVVYYFSQIFSSVYDIEQVP